MKIHGGAIFAFLFSSLLATNTLRAEPRDSVFPNQKGFDRHGGYLNHQGTGTGRFHLEEINGRHFLVTPEGYGFFSLGVTHTMGIAKPEDTRIDYFKARLGEDWGKANQEILSHFQTWGYNSLGYDAHATTQHLLPHFASCNATGRTSSWLLKHAEFPDVFDPKWKAHSRQILERTAQKHSDRTKLIGIYWSDMPAWDLQRAKNRNGQHWVDTIRALPEGSPGKLAYKKFLSENEGNASDEDFLVLIARELYSHVGPITRELFPETLVFGERYSGAALPWLVIQEALPWIDIVSVQPGAPHFPKGSFDRLYRETGKPIIICDHQVSFNTK